MEKKYDCEKKSDILCFFESLNHSGIKYTVIKNIGNEMPENLEVGKDIDILVDIDQKEGFHAFMRKIARRIHHPYNIHTGWENIYGLPEFEFWRLFRGKELVIDVSYMLCCKSIMPGKWLPLDKKIQVYVWENRWFDNNNSWWIMDVNVQYLYCVVRSVFDKHVFSDKYIMELEHLKRKIDWGIVSELLETVFFGFTDTLVNMLRVGDYENIINRHIRFEDY